MSRLRVLLPASVAALALGGYWAVTGSNEGPSPVPDTSASLPATGRRGPTDHDEGARAGSDTDPSRGVLGASRPRATAGRSSDADPAGRSTAKKPAVRLVRLGRVGGDLDGPIPSSGVGGDPDPKSAPPASAPAPAGVVPGGDGGGDVAPGARTSSGVSRTPVGDATEIRPPWHRLLSPGEDRDVGARPGGEATPPVNPKPDSRVALRLQIRTPQIEGAAVFVNGRAIGESPVDVEIEVLAPGDIQVQARKAGRATVTRSVRLPPGHAGGDMPIDLEMPALDSVPAQGPQSAGEPAASPGPASTPTGR